METANQVRTTHSALEQTNKTSTFWVGSYRGDNKDRYAGQTFVSPEQGELDCIKIYTSAVTSSCKAVLTLHVFDQQNKQWGATLGSATIDLSGSDAGKWISFPLSGISLRRGEAYGFRIQNSNGLLGVGETAGSSKHPPVDSGQEWVASSEDRSGQFYTYFSLAFKIEMV